MASESQIKGAIENIVNGKYTLWTIEVTDNPDKRKEEHGNPKHWHQWGVDTEQQARTQMG